MFKVMITVFMVALMAVPAAQAKKQQTVEIKDGTAVDKTHGWSISIPDNWKAKGMKEPSLERLFLQKKNYMINPYIERYGGDYTIPTILIYSQEFDGSTNDFEALIKRCLDEHKSDNKIINKLGIDKDCDYIVSGDVVLDSVQTRQIYVKRNYKRVLVIPSKSAFESGETLEYINDHEVHEIYLAKIENRLFVVQIFCEREFYDANVEEFHSILNSLKW